jgi:hypothetical protein
MMSAPVWRAGRRGRRLVAVDFVAEASTSSENAGVEFIAPVAAVLDESRKRCVRSRPPTRA